MDETNTILDVRNMDDFKTSSFTGYKKTDVKNKILECLLSGQIEEICYWTAEFVAAGHFMELWDICFLVLGKHIHLGNPLLTLFIQKQYQQFREIAMEPIHQQNPLSLRNHPNIREIMAETFCTMTLSDKKHSYEELKIQSLQITNHLRADHSQYASCVMHPNDPQEWTIAINEFAYHISNEKSYNMNLACFWVEWIVSFDFMCKKRKHPLFCERRIDYNDIESRFRSDFIWIIWETLVYYAQQRGNLQHFLINTLFQLFRVRYTSVTVKKRKSLIYFAISILTEPNAILKREILNESSKEIVSKAVENVSQIIYKSLKTHEIVSKDDFDDTEMTKWEKNKTASQSLQKIQIIHNHERGRF